MIDINNTPWHKLTGDDIKALLGETDGETFFFEFKKDDVRSEKIYKEISAFANTFGGYILIGIADDKSVVGCTNWTEQKVHNVIYNGITPLPDFDVKTFVIDGKTVLVIKIEEGPMPPYISTDGKICERVSSGSIQIKDSAKLSQLYTRHKDNLAKLEKKIGIEKLQYSPLPSNLFGYIDVGFELGCRDIKRVMKDFLLFDFTPVSEYLKKKCPAFSVSRVGNTCVITIGKLAASGIYPNQFIPEASMHNYMILMNDGSMKYRYCLFGESNGYVEMSQLVTTTSIFSDIYEMVFKKSLKDNFVYARKYEELTVLKQFTPYYKDELGELTGFVLADHIEKYGNSLIVSGTRIPFNDYEIIDKRSISPNGADDDVGTVIKSLFGRHFVAMGFVDIPEKIKVKAEEYKQRREISSV